jgi:xanthine dehydrogenase accessory factor
LLHFVTVQCGLNSSCLKVAPVHWIPVLLDKLAQAPAIWITVLQAQGSVPRGAGTVMAVFADNFLGTIGGGHLEFEAIAEARRRLLSDNDPTRLPLEKRFALGPSLGQCCGGALVLKFERVTKQDAARLQALLQDQAAQRFQPLALFGGGHVGKALVQTLAPLPFHVRWIDSRDEIFPSNVPAQVVCEHSNPVQAAVPELAPHSRVLIMSFSHAEDLDVVAACLLRQRQRHDLPFIGLIGSATKWATFKRRLAERGFSEAECQQVTCPIGVPGITGKEPEVIAIAVAAQLLQV